MILHRGLVDNVHGLAHQEYMLYFAQIVAEDHIQRAIKDGKLDDRSDEQIKYRQMRRLRLAAMQAGRDLGIDEDSPYYERIVGRVKVGS